MLGHQGYIYLFLYLILFLVPSGIILASHKPCSKLVDPSSIKKSFKISDRIGLVFAGLGGDARILVDKARKLAQVYKRTYQEEIPVKVLVSRLSKTIQDFTQSRYLHQLLLIF